tara:strand:+ start:4087 stop:4281 length:195 start_codon:yes stop_codon:yes gene_type:complete
MEWIVENLGILLDLAAKVVAVAAAVAAIVPSGENASGVIAAVRKLVDILALNIGNAENAKKPPA